VAERTKLQFSERRITRSWATSKPPTSARVLFSIQNVELLYERMLKFPTLNCIKGES
jgi:hypothetical protein